MAYKAKLSIKMMGISHAGQLAKIMAANGLAQNFAALSALVTEGIQKGHMRLHARKFSKDGWANTNEIEFIVQKIEGSGIISFDKIKEIVKSIKENK